MQTAFYFLKIARLGILLTLGSCSSCSSILQASRLATPDTPTAQPGAFLVEWPKPEEWVITPEGHRLRVPLLNRPTTSAPMGSQWVFVVRERQANGQFNGYWVIVPAGADLDGSLPF